MEWLIETLRVLREVRDWTDRRGENGERSAATRRAVHRATQVVEAAVEAPIVVERMGPAREPRSPRPPRDRQRRNNRPRGESRIPLDKIDHHAETVVRRLERAGFKAYLVGGCVRDLLLGLEPKDFDIATDARPEDVKKIFRRNSRIIGRRFRLVHVHFGRDAIIEVATFRANITDDDASAEGQDLLIRRDNVFGSEEEDALRRDFTINGLFFHVPSGQIIDHVDGLADIERRYLRMIGDPQIRLREDPVRILRAIRFKAKTDLVIDDELLEAMILCKEEIRRCAPARILEESLRLLRIGYSQETVRLLAQTGVLEILFPVVQSYIEDSTPVRIEPDEEQEDGEVVERDRLDHVLAYLDALDELIRRGDEVQDCVALAALVAAPLLEAIEDPTLDNVDRNHLLSDWLVEMGSQITLTKRLHEQLRQMFLTLRRFNRRSSGRRKRGRGRVTKEAVQLLEISLRANGRPLDELEDWEQQISEERPRERQRRGRRR